MISRRNNHLTIVYRGMVLLSFGMAFLILAGEIPAQESFGKTGKSAESNARPLQSKVSNLFSSFRTKKKPETVKSSEPKSQPTERKIQVEKPTPTKAETSKPTDEAAVGPESPKTEDKTATAPLPPEIAYFEKKTPNGVLESNETTKTSLRVAARSAPGAGLDREGLSHPEEPTISSLSSYSFDSRDWVEYFPVEHLSDGVESNRAEPAVHDPFSTNQTTAVVQEVRRTPTAQHPAPKKDVDGDWNGAAMPIPQAGDSSVRLAAAVKTVPEPTKKIEMESLGLDLTPSHAKRLKYTEICGVVVVQANFPLTEIKSMLEEIRLLQRDLNLYMGVPAPREKIELCLFRDETSYLKFLREVFPKAPRDRRALYIKLDGKPGTLLVQKTSEFEVDLRHEMVHAIVHASIRDVPIWLDEGLAKYFEVPIQDRAADNPYMKTIRWNVKFGAVPQLARLEKLEHIGEMGAREYRDSWAWVHFMIHHSPQTHRLLAGYLQMLATLQDNPDAKGKSDSVRIPPLSLYLNEMLPNPRENYRTHFQGPEKEGLFSGD